MIGLGGTSQNISKIPVFIRTEKYINYRLINEVAVFFMEKCALRTEKIG